MAMVLDALARYVVHMVAHVATDEVRRMLGVSGEIDKMGKKLLDLKNFLADADRRNITDDSVQEWVGQLQRAMYEATDILDLCQLKAMEHGPSTVHAGCFNPLLFCMQNPLHAREIGSRIKALNKRLDAIKERSAAFNFINLGSYVDHRSSMVHASRHVDYSRETIGDFDRSAVVGEKIEEDTRALVDQIIKPREDVNGNNMVLAIVGVGGIGKTTLAQKIFNDEVIQGEFSKKLWLSINQNFTEVELLRRAITEAGGYAQPHEIAKNTLHETLKKALIGHKTFLVMDDVWNHRAWDVLKIPLLNAAASGSQVLITTRDEGVGRAMTARWPHHHVNTLASDEAWSLLKKQVLSEEIDEDHISTLKDIGLQIIQKCGGLPLAVKVMGGLLRERGGLRRDWEQVLGDSKWSIAEMPRELNNAVYLSYEDMPPYLKQCFLHYSLLPKSKLFYAHHVVAMWISEGFIHGKTDDFEEQGEEYYKELISRNLIEPDNRVVNQKCCTMHDVIRSFAQYMTKGEALFVHHGDSDILSKLNSQKFLRLCIETNRLQSDELYWKSLRDQKSVRTLISTIQIKMKPGDSFSSFSSLRTLHIESADVAALVESLHKLKHLRYLALVNADISSLPENIGKMKLLQYLDLDGCKKIVELPDSIVNLGQLRSLRLASGSMIPRGFRDLTNMRRLAGFRAHMDNSWCSLDELGPLFQLKLLALIQLENVSAAPYAANARLGEKIHLIELFLYCTSKLGADGLVKEKEDVSEEEQQRIEKVFDELNPPPSVELINIDGYFGQQLPSWMMSTSAVSLKNLKNLFFSNLVCCTQLPTGLCQLPCLQFLQLSRAPCIRRVDTGFLQAATTPFPRLNKLELFGMVEWEEWEWEKQVQAMPRLESLVLATCKLRRIPPGLASNARVLKKLHIKSILHLSYLDNFPFVVELTVIGNPDLERITNLPNLQKLTVTNCTKLKLLECMPSLERLALHDRSMEKLPEYMRDIKPKHLHLVCRLWLLASVAKGQSGPEWDKFHRVENVKAYAPDGNNPNKWYVLYTRDNCKLDSNINRSTVSEETLSSSMDCAQGFESVYKMRRITFDYVCSLVSIPFFEDTTARNHTFVDGRVMSLKDRVAVALRVLAFGELPEMVGSSIGVDESTASLVTHRFVEGVCELAGRHHERWPYSSNEMEKIKFKFEKVHGLPNCCGALHTAQIEFRSASHGHEEHVSVLFQALFDTDMRFRDIRWEASGSMNQCKILLDSDLFKECEKGVTLNGSKLNGGSETEVGEYLIGDSGHPLRPWLLTPYQLEGDLSDLDYKKEFNRRHSKATDVVVLRAMARLRDTWKCLRGEGWHPNNKLGMQQVIYACCMLHNIVIDLEQDGGGIPSEEEQHMVGQVRQIADEDAVKVRDALSRHLIKSGVHTMDAEEELKEVATAASGSGNKNNEEQEEPAKNGLRKPETA